MGATILANLLGPILINRWFAKNTGLMQGLLMAFVGLFGAVFQPLTSTLITTSGWRWSYILLGGATLTAVLLSTLLLLRNKPEDKGLQPYGKETATGSATNKQAGGQANIDEGVAVRSASFYLLLLFMIIITGLGVFSQHVPIYGGILGYSLQHTGTALASILLIPA